MKRHRVLFAVLALAASSASAASWIFQPSYYSHCPMTGERAIQYQPEMPAIARFDPSYQESGYRHTESSIRVGTSADRLHVVQTWGEGENIRPYGEWLFPYRAGATPYGPWGNPQGPWTLPFDAWQNPYGLGQFQGYGYGQGLPYGSAQGPQSPRMHGRGMQQPHSGGPNTPHPPAPPGP